MASSLLTRRSALTLAAATALLGRPALADDDSFTGPPYAGVSGQLPDLDFNMRLASTGAPVTAAHFAGHPVIMYFGFTRCTDTCPLTMYNAGKLVQRMGADGQKLRVLFVTIDPVYDTLPRLKTYMQNFGSPPVFDGLRGDNAQLAAMAKRYGVQYTAVTSADTPDPVSDISHSIAVYAFGRDGRVQYIIGSLAAPNPQFGKLASIMKPLV